MNLIGLLRTLISKKVPWCDSCVFKAELNRCLKTQPLLQLDHRVALSLPGRFRHHYMVGAIILKILRAMHQPLIKIHGTAKASPIWLRFVKVFIELHLLQLLALNAQTPPIVTAHPNTNNALRVLTATLQVRKAARLAQWVCCLAELLSREICDHVIDYPLQKLPQILLTKPHFNLHLSNLQILINFINMRPHQAKSA